MELNVKNYLIHSTTFVVVKCAGYTLPRVLPVAIHNERVSPVKIPLRFDIPHRRFFILPNGNFYRKLGGFQQLFELLFEMNTFFNFIEFVQGWTGS